jgi:hypothetical protein
MKTLVRSMRQPVGLTDVVIYKTSPPNDPRISGTAAPPAVREESSIGNEPAAHNMDRRKERSLDTVFDRWRTKSRSGLTIHEKGSLLA